MKNNPLNYWRIIRVLINLPDLCDEWDNIPVVYLKQEAGGERVRVKKSSRSPFTG